MTECVNGKPSIVTQSTMITTEERFEKRMEEHENTIAKNIKSTMEEAKESQESQNIELKKRMQESTREVKELKAKLATMTKKAESMNHDIAILHTKTNAEIMILKALFKDLVQKNNKLERDMKQIQDEQISNSSYQSSSQLDRLMESEDERSRDRTGSAPVAIPLTTHHGSLSQITDELIEMDRKSESLKANELSSSRSPRRWPKFIRSPNNK